MRIRTDIGQRIRVMRLSRNMTQRELADAINQSPSSITMYETGRREPDMETIEALADVFNVPKSAIFGNVDNITPDDLDALEALHQNPHLGMLFDRSRRMSAKDIEAMLSIADAILRERDGHAD